MSDAKIRRRASSQGTQFCRMRGELIHRELTRQIIAAFYEAYNTIGYGFAEVVCAAALERELRTRGLRYAREYAVQVFYKGEPIAFQRLDFVVEDKVILEVKSGAAMPPLGERQLMNYLRGTNLEVGLLLMFGPKPEFKRVAHPRIV